MGMSLVYPNSIITGFELADLRVAFGAHAVARGASVEVATNGQQFSRSGVAFVWYPAPVVSSVTPSHGPTAGHSGVVVSGANFANGSHYACRFGYATVPASYSPAEGHVRCASAHAHLALSPPAS